MSHRWTLATLALTAAAFSSGLALGQGEYLRRFDPPGRKDAIPYTHAVAAGSTIYLAGTLGLDPETRKPPKDPRAEARLALEGLKAKLALAGATMNDLVSVQVFCSDITLYAAFNEVYAGFFRPGAYPVRAFIGSGPLLRGAHFEISGIAAKR